MSVAPRLIATNLAPEPEPASEMVAPPDDAAALVRFG